MIERANFTKNKRKRDFLTTLIGYPIQAKEIDMALMNEIRKGRASVRFPDTSATNLKAEE